MVGLVNKNSSPYSAAESPAPLTEQALHKSKTIADPKKPAQDLAQHSASRNNYMKKQLTAEDIIDEALQPQNEAENLEYSFKPSAKQLEQE